ncbi:MAG: MFS transporter, partial [Aquincola sp.]|nr:MFS transporter [Aquincola sp.]
MSIEPLSPSSPPEPPSAPPRTGTLAPLARPVFRMLWLATVTANVCMWMNDVAAAWLMTQLAPNPVWVARVQTAATLPVVLLGVPSGAMADIVDRRHWFMFTQLWVAVTAVLLSVLAFSGALNAPLLLVLVFANGIG